jgi:LmbE family N-acetylglucosaminyl deacetylase
LWLRSRPYQVEPELTGLVLAPHQDDEALGCGGLLFLKRLQGATMHVAYLTDGSASHPGHPVLTPAVLAERRQAEARTAMGLLGVECAPLQFLAARDGSLAHLDDAAASELAGRIAAILVQTRPDEIFLPCRHDGSSEHEAAFTLVMRAMEQSGQQSQILEFPVWSWWNPLLLIRPLLTSRRVWRLDFRGYEKVKQTALAAYVSQIQPVPPDEKPVLSGEFLSYFSSAEEFFFER